MSRPLIFVSHSGKSPAHKRQMLQLKKALNDIGLDAWLDFLRIETGDRWNDDISQRLRECQSAIVVFSEEALESEFVRYEVSYLAVRARTEAPAFRLHALTSGKLRPEHIAQGFYKSIRLDDFQFGAWSNLAKEVAKLAESGPKEFVPLSPAGELDEYLTATFRQLSPAILRTAAHDLGWSDRRNLKLNEGVAHFFTRELMTRSLPEQIKALWRIRGEVDRVDDAVKIFERIAPCWVDERAASILRTLKDLPPGRRVALLNGELPSFTPRMFLKRANPLADAVTIEPDIPAPGSTSAATAGAAELQGRAPEVDLLHEVTKCLSRRLGVKETELLAELAEREREKYPIPIVHLLLKGSDLALLESLLNSPLNPASFVVLTGAQLPVVPPAFKNRVLLITPELRHDTESRFHNEAFASRNYERRTAYLGNVPPSPSANP